MKTRILVIDDDKSFSIMLVALLSQAGYQAISAEDGNYGLQLYEAQRFDLIITDIIMPEREGIETIREVRKRNKLVPIIAISGGGIIGSMHYLQLAKEFGAIYTFQKPFDTTSFLSAVAKCLGETDSKKLTASVKITNTKVYRLSNMAVGN